MESSREIDMETGCYSRLAVPDVIVSLALNEENAIFFGYKHDGCIENCCQMNTTNVFVYHS